MGKPKKKKNGGGASKPESEPAAATEVTEMFEPYKKPQKNGKPSQDPQQSPTRPEYRKNDYQKRIDEEKQKEMGAIASDMSKTPGTASAEASRSDRSQEETGRRHLDHGARSSVWGNSSGSQGAHSGRNHSYEGGQREEYWNSSYRHGNNYDDGRWEQPRNGRKKSNNQLHLGLYRDDAYYGNGGTQKGGDGDREDLNNRKGGRQGDTRGDQSLARPIPPCSVCQESYDLEDRIPKSLTCGHSLCKSCVAKVFKKQAVLCPECRKTSPIPRPDDLPPNVALIHIITAQSGLPSIRQSRLPAEGRSGPGKSSPHGSNCLEQGAQPTQFCTTCLQFLCDDCNRIDHPSYKKCTTIPVKAGLNYIKKQVSSDVEAGVKAVGEVISDNRNYERALKVCQLVMMAANENINTAKNSLQSKRNEGLSKLSELKNDQRRLDESVDVGECMLACKKMKERRSAAEKWSSEELSKTRFQDDFLKTGRALLNLALHINDNKSGKRLLAQVKTAGGTKYHNLVVDAGRVEVHAAEPVSNVDETRALPIEELKSLVDTSSSLTFLDLSWGGRVQGRVYIRLTGATARGRQFQALCLGDHGPCLKNTHFHRIWWKGSPGEHIWGGDYDQGDGSGGASFFATNGSFDPALKRLPVTEGLVAGRYEKENVSTIFRIYTKSAPDATEEAAFARVEFGIDVVKAAIRHSNVREVMVADCGILIET